MAWTPQEQSGCFKRGLYLKRNYRFCSVCCALLRTFLPGLLGPKIPTNKLGSILNFKERVRAPRENDCQMSPFLLSIFLSPFCSLSLFQYFLPKAYSSHSFITWTHTLVGGLFLLTSLPSSLSSPMPLVGRHLLIFRLNAGERKRGREAFLQMAEPS